jgi:hypothetical protein
MYKTLPLFLLFLFSILFFENKSKVKKPINQLNSQFDRLDRELKKAKTHEVSYRRYKNTLN